MFFICSRLTAILAISFFIFDLILVLAFLVRLQRIKESANVVESKTVVV